MWCPPCALVSSRFSESEDWQCLATDADSVTIVSVPDIHRSGSSQIKVKNVADSVWERAYRWGNLAAAHPTGQYYAYALTGALLFWLIGGWFV